MNTQSKVITPSVIIQVLLVVVVIPFLPLLISWHWGWWEAWVYAISAILGFVISRMLAARRHPDLIAERAKMLQHEDAEAWDRSLSLLVGLGGGLIPLAAGLDRLFGWSSGFPMIVKILSLVVIWAGYAIASYALIENAFFSGTVRIQKERGHYVVSSGPYRWVRHPGYASALLTYLATPFFLDSLWAFIPAILLSVVLIVRTRLEDATLQEKLEGYRDYAKRVRYRILPGIW